MDVHFRKKESLRDEKLIQSLFKHGRSLHIFPFKVFYLIVPENQITPVQLLISVPKRHFKKAVTRNLLKRRIREAYRLNKQQLHASFGGKKKCLLVGLVYVAPQTLSFHEIQEKIILLSRRLSTYDS